MKHIRIKLSEFRKTNLQNLANLLKTGKAEVDGKPLEFDMSRYTRNPYYHHTTKCDTVGCAIGWNTILIPKKTSESYTEYSKRVLVNFEKDIRVWEYLFSNEWSYTDNNPINTGKRIQYFLDNGLPENWKEQLKGKAELIYLK